MLFKEEKNYLFLLDKIINEGAIHKNDRTGVGTRSLFGVEARFDLSDGKIPIISSRKMPLRFLPIELVWFIKGDTNVKFLKDNNVSIWDSWVIPETAVYDRDPKNILKQLEKEGKIKLAENYKEVYNHLDSHVVNTAVGILTGTVVPEARLLAGSIGEAAYGSQWRKWEDIRVVDHTQKTHYESMGYKVLTEYQETVTKEIPNEIIQEDTNLRVIDGTKEVTEVVSNIVIKKHYDQLQEAIELIKNTPDSRRIIVTAWNPGKKDQQSLNPCHLLYQYDVEVIDGVKYLSCLLYQRSADAPVGLVANWAQYAMLTHMVAQVTGCIAKELVWYGANVHVYENQVELVKDQLQRMPKKNNIKLVLNPNCKNIHDFKPEDIKITGYENFNEPIKYPVAV